MRGRSTASPEQSLGPVSTHSTDALHHCALGVGVCQPWARKWGSEGTRHRPCSPEGQAAGCENMNSTTGLPPHLHRGRPQSGGGVRRCSPRGSTQGRVLPSEAKSPLPALSGEWRWDRHAWSHLWTSCTGSSDKPLTQMLAFWVGVSLPVTQMTEPKAYFPTKVRALKTLLLLICAHALLSLKGDEINWQGWLCLLTRV